MIGSSEVARSWLPTLLYVGEYLLAFGVLGVLAWLPGAVLERRLPRHGMTPALRPVARMCLGVGFWIVLGFGLAAFGLLGREALWLVTAGIVAAAGWTFLGGDRATTATAASRQIRPGALEWAATAGGGLVLLLFFLGVLLGFVAWDADVYHLLLPKRYIAAGGFRPVELNVYAHWPQNVELLFTLAMLGKDYILATLVHFGFGLLTLGAIGVACHAAGRPGAGPIAMALFFCNGVVAWEFTIAYVELAQAFFTLAALLFLNQAAVGDQPARRMHLLLAGICGGLLAGVKLTGIVGAAVLGGCYIAWAVQREQRDAPRPVREMLIWYAAPVMLLWLPWLAKAAFYTGNPVYPFLYGWFGGPDWSTQLGAQFAAWQQSIGMGRCPADYLVLPLRAILLGGPGYANFDGRLNPLWIVLLPIALLGGRRDVLARRCLVVAGLCFVFWALTSQQMRFLVPIMPLLAIAGGIGVEHLAARVAPRRRRAVVGCAMALVAAGALVPSMASSVPAGGDSGGGAPRVQPLVLAHVARPPADSVYAFINRELPPDARVLGVNTNRGFFIDREFMADSFFEASQIAAWLGGAETVRDARDRLAFRRITHILVESRDWGIRYPRGLVDLLANPDAVEQLFEDETFELLRLR